MLEPFAGAPQDVLAVVLDACRYPTELVAATQWAAKPAAEREPATQAWPPPVRLLAERAPRTLQYLTQDIASTAVLGAAFQNQPNDVWLAFGRVTLAAQARAEQQATPAEASLPESAEPAAAAPPPQPPHPTAPGGPPPPHPRQGRLPPNPSRPCRPRWRRRPWWSRRRREASSPPRRPPP